MLAENVHKSHNLSALLRTCDAVGIQAMHAVSDDGAVQHHHRVSGGSGRWVDVRVHASLETACAELKAAGFDILAAHFSATAVDFRSIDYTRPSAILLGSELAGVSPAGAALADRHIIIPMRGMVASLNVSVAAAVILYEAERQRNTAGLYAHSRLAPEARARMLFEWCYPRVAAACRLNRSPYPPLDFEGELRRDPRSRP